MIKVCLGFFIFFPVFVSANFCKELFGFSKQTIANEIVQIRAEEFSHFQRKLQKRIVYQMNLRNRWLSFRESRPDMYNKEAYTAWLIKKQKSEYTPDIPYGYFIQERMEPVEDWAYRIRYEVVPRVAPAWINNHKLLKQDSKTREEYVNWAEDYYLNSRYYPPGYLQDVKNTLSGRFFQGLFGGFKKDRHLKDVMYSLGGASPMSNREKSEKSSTLLRLIRELKGQDKDRWLDGGTGSGFVLQDALRLISGERSSISDKDVPDVVGITYNKINTTDFNSIVVPDGFVSSTAVYPIKLPQSLLQKYNVLDGRLFQDIPIHELMPQFKLITDFFGVYSYSSDPFAVISKYLNVMHPKGTLGIVYNVKDFVKVRNKTMPLHEWLQEVAGNRLSIEHGKGWLSSPDTKQPDGEAAYMLIRNSSEGPIRLPPLTLVEYKNAERIFRPSIDIMNIL